MKRSITLLAILTLALPATAWSQAEALAPEVALDGLEQVEKTRHKEVYVAPGVDWGSYDAVIIDEATVAFRRNWQRDQNRAQPNRIRTSDMDRIRSSMSNLFDDVFSGELSDKGGYEIATGASQNVLRISPHILDLDLYAPDPRSAPGIQRSYVETAGSMTLKLHLYDSVTGDLLAVASEHKESPRRGYLQWANTVTNTAEFRMMLEGWARDLREGLENARSNSPTES